MTDKRPWVGQAAPMSPDAFAQAARRIGCDEASIRAVWEVEAAGRGFLKDGSLIRRFEPHKMPGSTTTWRDSMKIGPSRREKMFLEAYRDSPDAALRATSWGGPQIMGFNHAAAGYASAAAMVRDMADGEDAQLAAFVQLVMAWGIEGAIRAHDWLTLATRYNGNGQAPVYARKIEEAYRRHSGGKASPVVLRLGSQGAAVTRLQAALGIAEDGAFGPDTDAAVRTFQERVGLPVDGVVGKRTWAALEAQRGAHPKSQPTFADQLTDRVIDWGAKIGAGGAAGTALTEAAKRAPDGAVTLLWYGGIGIGLAIAVLVLGGLALRIWRDAA